MVKSKGDGPISVRLDERTLRELEAYRRKHEKRRPGLTRTAVIREAIMFLVEHSPDLT